MAEKILQTRIVNKHTTYDLAKQSSFTPKEGEIVLIRIDTNAPDGSIVPTYVMAVGAKDEQGDLIPLKNLKYLAAPASDVYAWAKAEVKPTYTAEEIALKSGSKVEEAIVALQTAIGDSGSVVTMIEEAIKALDVADSAVEKQFVTAVAEADGKISVTRRALTADDIPELAQSKITGLTDALAAKAAKTYVDEQDNAIKATIGSSADAAGTATVYGAIATAKKVGDDAQDYAENVEGQLTTYKTNNDARVKAIEDNYTTREQAGTIAQGKIDTLVASGQVYTNTQAIAANNAAIAALAGEGNTSTVKANADAIAQLRSDIGSVANVMNFVGVSTTDPESESGATIDNESYTGVSGDVIIYSEKEYVFDGSKWVKFGDASDSSAAISDLQTRVGNVENDLKAGGATYQSIVAAKSAADTADDKAEAAQSKADANETAIGVINGTGEGSIAKAVEDAKAELKSYADTAESDAVATAKGYTDTEVKKVDDKVVNLTTTVEGNATTAANATKAVADDLAAYKTSNNAAVAAADEKGQQGIDDAAAALKYATDLATTGQVNINKEDISTLKSDVDNIEANFAKVKTVDGVSSLVVGADEDVIIFDCGGVE